MERGCSECGEKRHPALLEFHHNGDDKKAGDISRLSAKAGASNPRLLEEMAKCIVLCANCHRLAHVAIRESQKILP